MIFINNLCQNGCGKVATHTAKNGKHTCTVRPAGCAIVLAKMKATTLARYGVENASSLHSVKQLRKAQALAVYGVDNVSKSTVVKQVISQKQIDYWKGVYAGKDFTIGGLSREQYSRRATQYATTQYSRNKDTIDPEGKRSKHWHVDHIYSVTDGFLNDVPIDIISNISNLRLISANANYIKHDKSEKTLAQLYKDQVATA